MNHHEILACRLRFVSAVCAKRERGQQIEMFNEALTSIITLPLLPSLFFAKYTDRPSLRTQLFSCWFTKMLQAAIIPYRRPAGKIPRHPPIALLWRGYFGMEHVVQDPDAHVLVRLWRERGTKFPIIVLDRASCVYHLPVKPAIQVKIPLT